jgi:glycosyltransferase involved in cell wall biosynthesis
MIQPSGPGSLPVYDPKPAVHAPAAGRGSGSTVHVDTSSPRIYVHLADGLDAVAYEKRYLAGHEPDRSPYGFHLAREMGFEVAFSTDHNRGLTGLAARILRRLSGVDIIHAFANRGAIASADVIWTMLDPDALAVAALMALRVVPSRPLVANVVWLADRWNSYNALQKSIYRVLLRRCQVVTAHSANSLPAIRELLPDGTVQLLYFGISTETFSLPAPDEPRPDGPIHIVAAGNDRTRDWETLVRAFGNDDRFEITIVCRWIDRALTARYANCEALTDLTASALRALYATATYIAIPMVPNVFSGITVALEAAALGIPVLVSDTGGVRTYFDSDEVLYVPVGDAPAMAAAAAAQTPAERARMAARAREKFNARDYSTRGMIGRYAALTRQLLAQAR